MSVEDVLQAPDAPPSPPPSSPRGFWDVVRMWYQHRWFIVGTTAVVGAAAVAASLLLPVYYRGTARLLLPDSDVGGLSAVLGRVSPAASALLGGGAENYNRFLAILTSATVLNRVVDRFDLEQAYEYKGERYARERTLKRLRENLEFEVDMEYDFLSLGVLDRSPRRAAEMANFLIDELNRVNADLDTQDAARYRRYVEQRYEETLAALDSARGEMRAFQERYGVIELPKLAESFAESMAQQRAQLAQAEIQYQALLSQFGPENPQVQTAREVFEAARRQQSQLIAGQDELMPVPLRRLPALTSEYGRIYQDLLLQAELLKVAQPLYEQAKFQEEREKVAVQVLDRATPPERKAKPKRALVVLAATVSAFVLALGFVLLREWLRRNRPRLAAHFRG